MSQFHSTVSRREFMKGLGLAGIGLGAASLAEPVFHDLDELMSSTTPARARPWWIKERDFFDTTVEIDWEKKERFDKRNLYAYTPEEQQKWVDERTRLIREGILNNNPGDTLKDHALVDAVSPNMPYTLDGGKEPAFGGIPYNREDLGIPRYQGSPEDNTRMVSAVARLFGAPQTGVVEITENTIKTFYECDAKGRPYTFQDVDKPYSDTKYG